MADDGPTPLARKLAARIRAGGPITVADYMAACLGDPEHGYYPSREPFGRGGDFVTAPEISQMFGELIGLWAVAVWEAMGSPPSFVLAELGPGRGTLMADAWRAAKVRPAFGETARVHLIETSPRLRAVQAKAVAAAGIAPAWHGDVASLPEGPLIVVANEFFDALPIRQFVRQDEGWAERMVGLRPDGQLAFGLRPAAPLRRAAVAGVHEICPAATAIMAELARRVVRHGGAVLAIDYGHVGPAAGDTLQAVRRHAVDDPLAHPGEADLTAHVDFGALAVAARGAGAAVHGPVGQGDFLRALGLDARAARLAGKDAATGAAIAAARHRLAAPEAMGKLFKAMAAAAPDLPVPGFDRPGAARDPLPR